jgi:hypothetical protein
MFIIPPPSRYFRPFLTCVQVGVLSIVATAQSSLSGLPFVRTFPTIEYKGGIQNWSIAQDRRGLLYVANNFGLLEFDGVNWQTFRVGNGTKVRSVAVDHNGKIYAGSQGDFGFFFPDAGGQLVYTSLADSLDPQHRNFDEAWSIYIDGDRIYFCTFTTIFIYNGKSFTMVESPEKLDLSFLVNNNLYVTQRNEGIGVLKGNAITPVQGGGFFKNLGVSGILPFGQEQFLVSTFQEGIFKIENGDVLPWNESMQRYYREANINCLIRLRSGNIAVGTQNNGLLILNPDGGLVMRLTRGTGLENRTVLSLFEDDLSNLWVGQNNGISLVELGSPFTFIGEQHGLPGTGYAAILDRGTFYLGTNTGLYARDAGRREDFVLVEGTGGQVYHIGRYNGELLAGHHKGALRIGAHGASVLSGEPGSWVFCQLKSRPGKLVEGTYNGLQLYALVGGRWKFQKRLEGFSESSRVMAEDDAGYLWVTHGYKGVFRIQLNADADSIREVKYYGEEHGFPTNLLINVFKVRNELLFTSEAGVFRYNADADHFELDPLFTSLLGPAVQLWYIEEDDYGNIYFTGTEHMGVFRRNSVGEYFRDLEAFNKVKRFLNDDLVNITILDNNEVLFAAKEGFIHYDPMRKTRAPLNFKTLIRKVTATSSGDSVLFAGNFSRRGQMTDHQDSGHQVLLPYSYNSLRFSFTSAFFEGNAEREYQYYLENYENQWSDWTTSTQKEYTNLKEGQYVFHVRSRNSSGETGTETFYRFTISPPWYRSVTAYVAYFLSALAVLLAAFRVLDRKYQREQKLLEERQQMELDEKKIEIEKISTQSKEEITRLQHEKLEADLRHMNNELGTATMHLLNKNEFITGIKHNLNQIIRKNSSDESKKQLLQITRDIEQNISADSDWQHFQFHFDRVHGDFTTRFKGAFPGLSPQEIKLTAYLRMNLSTKEIAQLLNISVRGVEISRYRLRKKLHLDRNQNLQDFILNF